MAEICPVSDLAHFLKKLRDNGAGPFAGSGQKNEDGSYDDANKDLPIFMYVTQHT